MQLEILFIHIHKTGGKSVFKSLSDHYDANSVLRVNQNRLRKLGLDTITHDYPGIQEKTKMVGGHFRYDQIESLHKVTGAKIITWLRDPIERVISNYFWRVHLNQKKGKEPMSFETYIEKPRTQNRISRALDNIPLTEIDFIGFLDTMNEDLDRLASLLKWPPLRKYHLNPNTSFHKSKPQVQPEIMEMIEHYNSEDINLFQEALELSRIRNIK